MLSPCHPEMGTKATVLGLGGKGIVSAQLTRGRRDGYSLESDLLDEVGGLLDDLLVTGLGVLGGVHLVDGDDELTHTEGEGEEGVLAGLSILGDTGLKLTGSGGNDEDGAIGLGGSSDHV